MTSEFYSNPEARQWRTDAVGSSILAFHRSLPDYHPSALTEVPELARELGVGRVLVKDESSRFGLPAFKMVGASYAVCRVLSARVGSPDAALPLSELRNRLQGQEPVTLVAATDGNHGRAVAHMARLLDLPARIFVSAYLSKPAWTAIESEGAEVVGVDAPYDDVVAAARAWVADAGESALHIQDTAWPGYERVPQLIVDGYSTIFVEADAQLSELGIRHPHLVAVPVGVGSLAEAAVRHYRSRADAATDPTGPAAPTVLSVEPENAPSVIASLQAGELTSVATSYTIMAGLNCGTPSSNAWPYLVNGMDAAVTVSEDEARQAVQDLKDLSVDAGPCGASSLAGIRAVASDPSRRSTISLGDDAVIVLLSTESRAANPTAGV
ncbi:MAG TPA: diaminopropionate ammonia-lyase [Homoserinimonas sp.]|nr:diaminopropionate ammonia-lyase [Homoserinimonas sp.]